MMINRTAAPGLMRWGYAPPGLCLRCSDRSDPGIKEVPPVKVFDYQGTDILARVYSLNPGNLHHKIPHVLTDLCSELNFFL